MHLNVRFAFIFSFFILQKVIIRINIYINISYICNLMTMIGNIALYSNVDYGFWGML